jgi:short-subunit dehydrogenase
MKTVLITGCSSGYGLETARHFHSQGWNVVAAMRTPRADVLPRSERLRVVALDVTKPEQIAAVLEASGPIDVLVNNAGVGWFGRAQEMPDEKLDELVATNFKGVVHTTQAALPWMLERRSGAIINVASVAGFRPSPYSAVYGATKHAVVGFSHALRGELSGTGVKVCVIYPGVTPDTEFFKDHAPSPGPRYSSDWVANLIVRTARRPRRDAIVFPMRLAYIAEPLVGGLIDHAVGEIRRRNLKG